LGTLGTIRIFIKDFAMHAKLLVHLTRKNIPFEFAEEQVMAMEKLKMFVQNCLAIKAIDYESEEEVTLAVDSSWMAVGFVLSQQEKDGKRYSSRYGLITWNETEQRYSQAKLELYGLFRALKDVKMYIVGIKNLVVEVDAKYIKGMINNPDIQPNASINRWIAGILLFDFKLLHVSAKDHAPADGLSRRRHTPEDPDDEDDTEEWIDKACSFGVEYLNQLDIPQKRDPENSRIDETFSIHRNSEILVSKDEKDQETSQTRFTQTNLEQVPDQEALKIPRSPKAIQQERRLRLIKKFLKNPKDA
jgi:RNase H-like domain found in reverse transcriptase